MPSRDHLAGSHADALAAIETNGFLARLSPELAGNLIRSANLVYYPGGSISDPARDAAWAAVVVSGVVRQYLPMQDGRQVTVGYAEAGDLVGGPYRGSRRLGPRSRRLTPPTSSTSTRLSWSELPSVSRTCRWPWPRR